MNKTTDLPGTAFVTGGSGFVGTQLIKQLVSQGWKVRALTRSEQAKKTVSLIGAECVSGEISDSNVLATGMEGCEVVFHVAAHFRLWGKTEVFNNVNVRGMDAIIDAAVATTSIRRIVYVSAAAVVMGDPIPLLNIDETRPYQSRFFAPYSSSKAEAERRLLEANDKRLGLETVAIRPPMIWGKGMPMLDQVVETVKAGQWQWVDGGEQAMSTCHVDNLVHALMLAARDGKGGESYFIADENHSSQKSVFSSLLATRGVQATDKSISFRMAWFMSGIMETIWQILPLKTDPPITRQMLQLIGKSMTLNIGKARRELGYHPVITWAEGIEEMNELP